MSPKGRLLEMWYAVSTHARRVMWRVAPLWARRLYDRWALPRNVADSVRYCTEQEARAHAKAEDAKRGTRVLRTMGFKVRASRD